MLAALALSAVIAAAPGDALAQRRTKTSPSKQREAPPPALGLGLGFMVGPSFSLGDGPVGFKGGPRLAYRLTEPTPGLSLAVTLPITLGGSRAEQTLISVDTFGLELLPGARATFDLAPKLRLYADAGLGAVIYQFNVRFLGNRRGSAAGFGFRFGLGLEYAVLERLDVFVEPMQLLLQAVPSVVYDAGGGNTVTGSNMAPHWTVALGVVYRL